MCDFSLELCAGLECSQAGAVLGGLRKNPVEANPPNSRPGGTRTGGSSKKSAAASLSSSRPNCVSHSLACRRDDAEGGDATPRQYSLPPPKEANNAPPDQQFENAAMLSPAATRRKNGESRCTSSPRGRSRPPRREAAAKALRAMSPTPSSAASEAGKEKRSSQFLRCKTDN